MNFTAIKIQQITEGVIVFCELGFKWHFFLWYKNVLRNSLLILIAESMRKSNDSQLPDHKYVFPVFLRTGSLYFLVVQLSRIYVNSLKEKICLQLKSTPMNVSLSHWPLWHQALKLVARVSLLSWHHRGNFALCKIYRRHSFTTSHTCSCSTEKFCLFFLEKPNHSAFLVAFLTKCGVRSLFSMAVRGKR